jgi:AcrR family transcriptional regulator
MAASNIQAPTKKLGLENSATRAAVIEATERLIREQGFARITSRLVAAEAGIKPPLIHYYFSTMDDLYIEVFRRGVEADLERLTAAVESEDPLRAMWELSRDPIVIRFATEFMALANHNEAVRSEMTLYAEKRRAIQAEAISRDLAARGVTPKIPPMVTAVLLENITRGLMLESALGISLGHAEVEAFLEAGIDTMEVRWAAVESASERQER